ncbi:MAG: hypothetical protein CBB71_16870 [Rhodopirellula sp. TMED11]|nr:MAG: hypothetical protein CBB71_16870 [Rhodopirellula sp. TMED11]
MLKSTNTAGESLLTIASVHGLTERVRVGTDGVVPMLQVSSTDQRASSSSAGKQQEVAATSKQKNG